MSSLGLFLDPCKASILAQSLIQLKEKPAAVLETFLSISNGSHFGSEGHRKPPCWLQLSRQMECFLWCWMCFSPRRVSVADVVLLGPASKHLFLSDEAVVWSAAPPLVLEVRHTLVWTSGFVIVIRHPFGLRTLPTGH